MQIPSISHFYPIFDALNLTFAALDRIMSRTTTEKGANRE